MNKITIVLILSSFCGLTYEFALAPATVGGLASSAGRLSNTIKETKAWKRLTSNPNSIVRTLPARAMEVVQDVVERVRQEGRVILITPNGGLRGRVQSFKSGIPGFYYSFKGVRYGEAPVGARRFRSAVREQPWKGVRNAIREGNSCPHQNMLLDTYKGNEDCLFLNVYTKQLPNKESHPRLPVMVWLHGGGFSFGSGNAFLYGPDFLVAEDVVLVTLNYRLGPLGFLSVGGDASGNAGLKDQVLALKWVQENIAAFGGDPQQVTLFGESAGAASVHFLMLSPLAAGLFHRAISESGSALNPWALAENPKERAFRLGRVLGFETNSTEHLLAFLRKIPARKLVDYAARTLTPEDSRKNIGLPFVPAIEDPWDKDDWSGSENVLRDEPFLTEHPLQILKRGNYYKVPYITGFNSHEAMLFLRRLQRDPKLLEIIDKDFIRLIPIDLNVTGGRDSQEAHALSSRMREFYIGPRTVSEDTIEEMINLLTDTMFIRGIVDGARLHSVGNVTTFLYRFGFDGTLGLYKRLMGISRPGVCHGDELGYLFHFGFFNLSLEPSSPEIQVKKRMVSMWTNFAKYGNPTPLGRDDSTLAIDWTPLAAKDAMSAVPYLDIEGSMECKYNPEQNRMTFWDSVYAQYNGKLMP
ncbi:venom carboxylesterase-6 isoform X2 [Bradysia coprophila]|uniref:venom carboxylesterase-6 isoform X2 n=1 Tax=Bradysia coprophila TaxID=38358 RepID=UPI00187DC9A3|nr:venom carboxylesterase-6 isoform X2 [Bradysia coprophila]